MATTIREAVAERGDDWAAALPDTERNAHWRNENLAIVGSNAERADFYRMRAIQDHPEAGVRRFYREETPWCWGFE